MSKKTTDIFKALGHPTRREILRLIAKKGSVSYKELAELEPKAGVLYHHLRLLGDLIYQDKNKLYRLTEKGMKAFEFLETFFLEPSDKGFHMFLTPRPLLERIEGKTSYLVFLSLYLLSLFSWLIVKDYMQIFILLIPHQSTNISPIFTAVMSWLISVGIITGAVRYVFQRYVNVIDLSIKLLPAFMVVNVSPLIIQLIQDSWIVELVAYIALQILALFLIISAVSVSARISLRKAGLVIITLHYLSIIIYVILKIQSF